MPCVRAYCAITWLPLEAGVGFSIYATLYFLYGLWDEREGRRQYVHLFGRRKHTSMRLVRPRAVGGQDMEHPTSKASRFTMFSSMATLITRDIQCQIDTKASFQ